MTRGALYLRVSTDLQTTDNQRPALERIAAGRGLEVVEVIEETMSGAKKRRPGLDQLMRGAHEGRYTHVLVWAIDRLGRSMHATVQTVLDLDRLGVQVISHQEPWLVTDGPVRPLLLSIFAWVGEQERARLVERTREGLARARRAGKRLGRPAVAIDVDHARVLRARGKSLRAVAAELGVSVATVHKALAAQAAA